MKYGLEALRRHFLAAHVTVLAILCLMASLGLWRARQGGPETPFWVALAAAGLGGTILLARNSPGCQMARTLNVVGRFQAGLCGEAPEPPAPDDLSLAVDRLEARLRSAAESAARSRETFSTFLGAGSHELRQPLAALRGWLEYAARQEADAGERRLAIAEALKQAERAGELARVLLELGKIQAGVAAEQKVPLASLLRRIAAHLPELAEDRHFSLAIESESEAAVRGNGLLLEHVVLNVIENALKYTRRNGTVRLSVSRSDQDTCLTVSDDGPGIPQEELGRIFEPFRRGSLPGQTEGSGLGLALARLIVESAGGRIRVESELGCGSCFRIRLPLAA
jgi:two-component system sensor histidine kinase TctE